MKHFIPIIFALLWSTGFIGAKFGLPYAEPFTLLMWRMLIVVPLFYFIVLILKRPKISLKDALIQALVGLLIHGFYLGGVFAAIAKGTSSGLSSLIVSLNPLVIAIASSFLLHTLISKKQWLSLILGFVGVVIVLYGSSKWQGALTSTGIAWLLLSLISISIGTLIQKKYGQNVGLIRGSMYQFSASLVFYFFLSLFFETGEVDWNISLILTLAWLVLVLSFTSVLLLMYMIKNGEATRVASYFYLVPPLSVFQGWLFFDEKVSAITILGSCFIIAALIINKPKPINQNIDN